MSAPGYVRSVQDGRNDFGTPEHVVQFYAKIYGEFEVDAAANEENHKAPIWYGPGGVFEDAIARPWLNKRHWLNPPYGRDIGLWITKTVVQCARLGHDTKCALLVPNSTETDWWFQAANAATHIRAIKNRISFIDPRTGFPMDGNPAGSTLFWFGPNFAMPDRFYLDVIPEPAEFTELRKQSNAARATARRQLARAGADPLVF